MSTMPTEASMARSRRAEDRAKNRASGGGVDDDEGRSKPVFTWDEWDEDTIAELAEPAFPPNLLAEQIAAGRAAMELRELGSSDGASDESLRSFGERQMDEGVGAVDPLHLQRLRRAILLGTPMPAADLAHFEEDESEDDFGEDTSDLLNHLLHLRAAQAGEPATTTTAAAAAARPPLPQESLGRSAAVLSVGVAITVAAVAAFDQSPLSLDWGLRWDAWTRALPVEAGPCVVACYVALVIWHLVFRSTEAKEAAKAWADSPGSGVGRLLVWWNYALVVLSLFLLVGCGKSALEIVRDSRSGGAVSLVCDGTTMWAAPRAGTFWQLMFMWSKFPELLDTVLLVLRGRPVIFLHWYHHVTVLLYVSVLRVRCSVSTRDGFLTYPATSYRYTQHAFVSLPAHIVLRPTYAPTNLHPLTASILPTAPTTHHRRLY